MARLRSHYPDPEKTKPIWNLQVGHWLSSLHGVSYPTFENFLITNTPIIPITPQVTLEAVRFQQWNTTPKPPRIVTNP